MSARVVAACRKVTSKPIITKLSPNQTDIHENARRCIEAGTRCARGDQHDDGHGHRREHAQAGDRQRPGRLVRPCDQADRVAESAPGLRSRAQAQRADHRPGRHRHTRTMRSSSSSPAPRPWASALRCSTIRWCARRSTRASASIWHAMDSDRSPISSAPHQRTNRPSRFPEPASAAAWRLFVVHRELFELARESVTAPAKQPCCFLTSAFRFAKCGTNQCALELRHRIIE